jgi:hypothetical protein
VADDVSSSDSEDEEEAAAAPQRPAKRLKAAAPRGADAAGGDGQGAQAGGGGASGTPGWRNKEKPLVLCSRGIPSRCALALLPLQRACASVAWAVACSAAGGAGGGVPLGVVWCELVVSRQG